MRPIPPIERYCPGTLGGRCIDCQSDWLPGDGMRLGCARHRFFMSSRKKPLSSELAMLPAQAVEFAVCGDVARGADDRGPGNPRERAAQADAAHAKSRKILHRQIGGGRHEEIHRFRRNRLHHRRDLFARLDAGRIEAIGAGRGERFQAADGLVEIGPPADEAFAAGGKHHIAAGRIDGGARSAHARERKLEVVEGDCGIGGPSPRSKVPPPPFRRTTSSSRPTPSGASAKPPSKSAFRGTSVAAASSRKCCKHRGAGHGAVGKPLREGEPRAGGGERFKSQPLQIARRTHVPGIGDDETSFGMELAERLRVFRPRWAWGSLWAMAGRLSVDFGDV